MSGKHPALDWRCYAVSAVVAVLSVWPDLAHNPPFTYGISLLGGAWLSSSLIVVAIWTFVRRVRRK